MLRRLDDIVKTSITVIQLHGVCLLLFPTATFLPTATIYYKHSRPRPIAAIPPNTPPPPSVSFKIRMPPCRLFRFGSTDKAYGLRPA